MTCCIGHTPLQLLDRQNSNAAAGPSKSSSRPVGRQRNSINYSLLAGNRKPDAKVTGTAHKGSKKGGHKQSPAPQSDMRKDQAAIAVAAAIASGSTSLCLVMSLQQEITAAAQFLSVSLRFVPVDGLSGSNYEACIYIDAQLVTAKAAHAQPRADAPAASHAFPEHTMYCCRCCICA